MSAFYGRQMTAIFIFSAAYLPALIFDVTSEHESQKYHLKDCEEETRVYFPVQGS
jgi:hypothetical protein